MGSWAVEGGCPRALNAAAALMGKARVRVVARAGRWQQWPFGGPWAILRSYLQDEALRKMRTSLCTRCCPLLCPKLPLPATSSRWPVAHLAAPSAQVEGTVLDEGSLSFLLLPARPPLLATVSECLPWHRLPCRWRALLWTRAALVLAPPLVCLPQAPAGPTPPASLPQSTQVEGIALDEDSLSYLGEIGEETSLRHAVQVRLLDLEVWSSLQCGRVSCVWGDERNLRHEVHHRLHR